MKQFESARLRRILAAGIFIGCIVPLALFACGSIGYVKAISVKELETTAQRLVEHGAEDITTYLQGKVALLSALIRLHPIEHLRDSKNLTTLFQMVNDNGLDGDIVALELIGTGGDQLAHAGPNHGEDSGGNYKDTEWFKQVLARGVAVSDVFADHRGNPYFVIALTDPLKTCVLRATINSLVFGDMLRNVRINPNNEPYILSVNGTLQTPGLRKDGNINAIENSMLKYYHKVTAFSDKDFFYTSKWFDGNSWILILKTHFGDSLDAYYKYRRLVIYVLLVVSACFMFFSILMSRIITKWIEKRNQQLKILHNQLVHEEKMANIGRVAAGITKDIKSPLQQIQKQANKVEDLVHQENIQHINRFKKNQDALDKIRLHARCMRTTLERRTRLSRKIGYEYNIQVNMILREFLFFYENEALDRNIVLNLQFDERLPIIRTDGSQVQQLLLNLIEKALDAVGVDGHIDIITYNKSGEVYVQIADSGPGITSERIERRWQPFPVTRGTIMGVGLDLSMYSNFVYKLGGRISVKDRPQGGTLVTLSLPVSG
jgi:two-component system NtrC family sensor kinase